MGQLAELADAGIENVARIKRPVLCGERGFGRIEMADVVFGWVFSPARVEQMAEVMLQGHRVMSLPDDIIVMENVAEEVPVIELMAHAALDLLGERLYPSHRIAREREV